MKYQWSIAIPIDPLVRSQGQFEDQRRGLLNNGDTGYVLKIEMTTITAKVFINLLGLFTRIIFLHSALPSASPQLFNNYQIGLTASIHIQIGPPSVFFGPFDYNPKVPPKWCT